MADGATIARPYARAAFDHAHAAKQLAPWGELLAKASIAVSDERVRPLIGNPHVKRADLVGCLLDVVGAADDPQARNFVQLLADNGRLAALPQIAEQYAAMRAEVENTVEVTVTSAMPLTPEQSEKLTQALTARLKRKVQLFSQVDPALIGGAVVKAGDFVVDGSLRGRIERLGNTMAGV